MRLAARTSLLAALVTLLGATGAASVQAAALPAPVAPRITHAQAEAELAAPQARIFNGTVATIQQAPWQVLVYSYGYDAEYGGQTLMTCGGSMISDTQVVTAAHCVADTQNAGLIGASPNGANGLGVIAGISNYHSAQALTSWFHQTPVMSPTDTEEDRVVTQASVHPGWAADENGTDQFPSGDVAVITVSQPFTATPYGAVGTVSLPPIAAPVDGEPIPFNTSVRMVGFGQQVEYTAGNQQAPPNGQLYAQSLSVVDPDICTTQVDSAVNICGQTPTGTTCHGDSGSGLVTNDATPVIVGLVSSGPEPCTAGNPTFFTSLVAPENRLFVNGSAAPPRAPRQFTAIALGAPTSFRVGDTVSCSGGSFSPITMLKWKLTDDLGNLVATGTGASLSYVLQPTDLGRQLTCRAYASSPGGVAVSERETSTQRVAAASVASSIQTGQGTSLVPAATTPVAAATFSIVGTPEMHRRGVVTVSVLIGAIPSGSDSAIVTVPRIATLKRSKPSIASVTNPLKAGATTTRFNVHVRVPKRAQTGTRSLAVNAWIYKHGALVGTTRKVIRVKITR